ncbi:ABC transporter permease [Fuerstiella marisgermanici]|uniref:Aliphatic sulfonates transport permease protein SsuC n=1 Tax=Fuerstiella marisgermanici TaxID=1891926 RepID=A0A1P8WPK3_9PLAN|nr:ABC transporter permease [Fuerstiella marisgermanici]APZ95983.1 Putative aliphatic sulfonates transport permease protein SsuC [Fuerstiella marisgermanici]
MKVGGFDVKSAALLVAAPLCVLICSLSLWQLVVWARDISIIVVPSPIDVARALYEHRAMLSEACWQTAKAAMTGLFGSFVIGVLGAFAFSQSRIIRSAFYPYAILLQTVPIIALAPIVVVSIGRGFYGIVIISTIISIFPVITSTTTGLLQVDANLLELFRLNNATRWQTLWKLRLPNALPYLISGLRIAGGAAIVGAIVGEFFVGDDVKGLGVLIQNKSGGFQTDELYAAVVVSTLLGVAAFVTVTVVGEWILRRFLGMSLSGVSQR